MTVCQKITSSKLFWKIPMVNNFLKKVLFKTQPNLTTSQSILSSTNTSKVPFSPLFRHPQALEVIGYNPEMVFLMKLRTYHLFFDHLYGFQICDFLFFWTLVTVSWQTCTYNTFCTMVLVSIVGVWTQDLLVMSLLP